MAASGDFRWPPTGRFPWPPSIRVTEDDTNHDEMTDETVAA
jgi:hypothetical protein